MALFDGVSPTPQLNLEGFSSDISEDLDLFLLLSVNFQISDLNQQLISLTQVKV